MLNRKTQNYNSKLKSKKTTLSFNIYHVVLPCRQAGLPFAICVLSLFFVFIRFPFVLIRVY